MAHGSQEYAFGFVGPVGLFAGLPFLLQKFNN